MHARPVGFGQREKYPSAFYMIRQVKAGRCRVFVGNGEVGSILKIPGCLDNSDLSGQQEIWVKVQLLKAVGMSMKVRCSNMNFMVEIAFLLLEMLGLEKETFAPDYTAVFSHLGG